MNKNKIILLVVSSGILIGVQLSAAATIPAGTTLQVRTTNAISSRDIAGKKFQGTLIENVSVKGHVVLPSGTGVVGIVQSPRVAIGSSTRPLTLRLTQMSVRGRMVPIKAQDFEAENAGIKGRRGTRLTGGAFLLPPKTILQFRLSQSLNL